MPKKDASFVDDQLTDDLCSAAHRIRTVIMPMNSEIAKETVD
jgi:hypothetical protein